MAQRKKVEPTKPAAGKRRGVRELLTEPTTWAGLLTAGAAIATGGMSVFMDPLLLTELGAGLALILAKEG